MRLADLSPEWLDKSEKDTSPAVDRYIDFRCPKCPDEPMPGYTELRCRIVLPVTTHREGPGTGWGWNGETDFEKVTLTPSVFHHCASQAHFFVREGEIQFV